MPKINIDGLHMYYEVAGEGDPLVLISGLSGDHLAWTITGGVPR
jgi:3-oxoadipate enol-lactonase